MTLWSETKLPEIVESETEGGDNELTDRNFRKLFMEETTASTS